MSWLDDVLGNPSKKTARKTVPVDVPVAKKPVEAEKKPEPQAEPAEPAKTEAEAQAKPAKEPAPAKNPPEMNISTNKRKVDPPVIDSAPSKADLKEVLRKQNEIDAKMSVNVPLSQLYARLSTEDKLRLIYRDSSVSDVIWKIVGITVDRNADAILDYWGAKLLKTAMDCDDLRDKLIGSVIKNDAWAEAFCNAFDENEPEMTSEEIRDFAKDMLENNADSMKIFIDVLMASPKGRKLLYNAINS